jgi:hypothetical protein
MHVPSTMHPFVQIYNSPHISCSLMVLKLCGNYKIFGCLGHQLGIYVGHLLTHSGNLLVVYNLYAMHVSPQFHVICDCQFTSINTDTNLLTDSFYSKLYEKAQWMHNDFLSQQRILIFSKLIGMSHPNPKKGQKL